jgi:hypothetical protein
MEEDNNTQDGVELDQCQETEDQEFRDVPEEVLVYVPRFISFNNRFFVKCGEVDRTIKAIEKSGFAFMQQKEGIVALETVVDTMLPDGSCLMAGSKIYVKEELLFTAPWGKKTYTSPVIKEKFLIIDAAFVEFLER